MESCSERGTKGRKIGPSQNSRVDPIYDKRRLTGNACSRTCQLPHWIVKDRINGGKRRFSAQKPT